MKIQIPEDGVHRTTYSDGKPSEEYTIKNGKEHGVHRLWHENGQVSAEISYYHGEMNGRMRWWAQDGMLYGQRYYFDALPSQRRVTRQNVKRFRGAHTFGERRLRTPSAIM